MATSVRIRVGVREFQLETDTRTSIAAGALVPPRDAMRVLAQVREPRDRVAVRSLVVGTGSRSFEWDEELDRRLATLLDSGRVRLRAIEARSTQILGKTRAELPEEREDDAIEHALHHVIVELVDAEGNPISGEPFRIRLPDGTVQSLALDEQGKAEIRGIVQPGACEVCFYQRDASAWSLA